MKKFELNYSANQKFESFVELITSNDQREFYGFWEKIQGLGINPKPLQEIGKLDQVRFIYELEKHGIPVKMFSKELGKYAYKNTGNSRIPMGATGIIKVDSANNSLVFTTIEKDFVIFLPKGGKFKSFEKILSFLSFEKIGPSKGLAKKIETHRVSMNAKKSISQLTREIATAKIASNTAKVAKKSIETGNYKEAKAKQLASIAQSMGFEIVPKGLGKVERPQIHIGNGFAEPQNHVGRKEIASGYNPEVHNPKIEVGQEMPELPELPEMELVSEMVKNQTKERKQREARGEKPLRK